MNKETTFNAQIAQISVECINSDVAIVQVRKESRIISKQ